MTLDEYVTEFTNAYAETMLWANTDEVTSAGGYVDGFVDPADWRTPADGWQVRAFDAASQASIREDCEGFVTASWDDLQSLDPGQCGHDFALTRNRHGTGFWDRDLGDVGARLTEASHAYGESTATYADDYPVRLDSI